MKKLIFLLAGILVLTSAVNQQGDGAFDAQINTLKQECKELIKATRYEGSKITYYNGGSKQTKSVELFMFLPNEYQFAVSTKKCKSSVTLRLYDAASDVKDRTMVKEYKNTQGKNFVFNTTELNKIYRKKVPAAERLKNLHIEYVIGSGKSGKEAIVLVMGHKA
ncbi:MAG: hypothetical protein A3D31_03565 [Candidatus Fluviicola riflensis]|nr:MAG: hypothetical protein CHH17_11465 [Candidatus Fluviicola riflensis]OGS79056.1 MAG: hypothetical protein A3D31_03565 [Candidatus Fluviicola riflensis]OGS86079.1 MAG: hypothetical protein A3E30_11055 [Fluviicola sp. RIFCSPHIGHO2_12_FULL_43_24]OGS86488.1 MAG: hypothetical protein A2724_03025 [Fluviicola sp. RIFCSPHIGHO2_01_FULL_43_53]